MGQTILNPQFNPVFSTIVNNRNWAAGVADLARGYARPLQLIDALNPQGSFSIEDPEGKLRVGFYPRQEVVGTVDTVTQNGVNLDITWTNPNYEGFRPKVIVQDSNHWQGIVVSVSPGAMTIAPSTNPAGALDATLHFVAGRSVNTLSSGSGNFNSTGLINLYKEPDFRYNYSAVSRESHTVARREKFQSFEFDKVVMSYTMSEIQMIQRFMKNKVKNMLYSAPGTFNSSEGATNQYEGLRLAVFNQGGRFISVPALPSTADVISDLDFMASQDPAMEQNFLWIMGRRMWAHINTIFGGTNIQYTVSKAVINGNQLNFDIPQVTINGITVKVMVLGLFDDKVTFPTISSVPGAGLKESNTYAMLNLAPISDAVTGGLVPSVRKFHFAASNITGGAETLYVYVPGMVPPGNSNANGGTSMGKYNLGTSTIDGGSFQILEDGGIDFTADGCVWRELSE